jgi:RNA polymerase sigma-70 factor (ECF subfamily)
MVASTSADELRLLAALRRGDEAAFTELVNRHQNALLRLARLYVRSRDLAEEVVQDTWLGVLSGINRFEGRSSLKTWIFRILINRAKTLGVREARNIPFSALAADGGEGESDEPAVDPDRFLPADHPQWPHHWAIPPQSWGETAEKILLGQEVRGLLEAAIAELPRVQGEVISLRDVEGWTAEEVCGLLGLSEVNQRVLLHRARSKVRKALEAYLRKAPSG